MPDAEPPSPDPDGHPREFEKIDASAFVESDGPAAASHSAAEGVPQATEAEMGRTGRLGTLKQMALSTEPTRPLDEVENPWDPDLGGLARVYRGIQKATGYDGLPAIADVGIGFMEWAWNFQVEEPGREGQTEQQSEQAAQAEDPITAAATADES